MIGQIQLRGISRTPSDRMTSDGGCADSLNMHLDGQETAPTLPPKDLGGEIRGQASGNDRIMYIHKMTNTTRYIALGEDNSVCAYGGQDKDTMGDVTFDDGEEYCSACAIGNILVIYTSLSPYYFLFNDGSYRYLGSAVPSPQIEVVSKPARFLAGEKTVTVGETDYPIASDEQAAEVATLIWDSVSKETDELRDNHWFFAPFFVRTAMRLYDGSYINSSVPVFCGGGVAEDWVHAVLEARADSTSARDVKYTLPNIYDVHLKAAKQDFTGWESLIQSIDVFASKPIYTPAYGSPIEVHTNSPSKIIFKGMHDDEKEDTIKEAVLSKSLFYKVASFSLESPDDMAELQDGYTLENSDAVGGELLETQERLPDSYRDGSTYLPVNGAQSYNKRLLLAGAQEVLPHGEPFLNGLSLTDAEWSSSKSQKYNIRYLIRDADGLSHTVYGVYYAHTNDIRTPNFWGKASGYLYSILKHSFGDEQLDDDLIFFKVTPYAWIAYPDARCYAVEVSSDANADAYAWRRIPMRAHPYLECAYAFFGFGKSLHTAGDPVDTTYLFEDRVVSAPNKIFLSELENPFSFPAGGIITFSDEVTGAASTSVPLSEGQFGQFPLYVFTGDGIRVLTLNSGGTFSTNTVYPDLSRHIALKGTIASIEQAVVFITERGVMLLTGGTVTELSSTMNGKPYSLDDETDKILLSSEWKGIYGGCKTNGTFMNFMRQARIAYDSNGARLLFFKDGEKFLWVYMLASQTWHRMQCEGISYSPAALNSYPDCLVSAGSSVFNFSTNLTDAALLSDKDNPVRGIVVTRPFDLGAPDVRKAIRSIRVRGQYNKGDVQYLLLGSFDGLSWKRLTSLRGGSYKLFRLVLLCNLTAAERISWVDVDYDTRYANRLR